MKGLYCTTAGFALTSCDYVSQSSSGQRELPKMTAQNEERFTSTYLFPALSHFFYFFFFYPGSVDPWELGQDHTRAAALRDK